MFVVADEEWNVDVLDVEAYLKRIDFGGPITHSAETLAAVHRAHVAAIPFENLDVILGRGVSVDLDDIQTKLVGKQRGGYCYEHALLFGAVLQRLGYVVDRLLARVGDDLTRPRPRTHMVVAVTVGDTRWLADVGFGSGLLEPIPLRPYVPVTQGAWTYQLVRGHDAGTELWLLQERTEDTDWATQYSVAEERHHQSDVVMSNHYTSTWPASPFVQRAVVVRKDPVEVRRLLGRTLSLVRPGTPEQHSQLADHEVTAAVRALGVHLDQADAEALIAGLPPLGIEQAAD